MRYFMYLSLITVFVLISLVGCSTENIDKVNIYKMESFEDVQEGSLLVMTDSNTISLITKGFSHAKRQEGIVNIGDPHYQIELGKETYLLWINETAGTIMNVKDTHTIYSLSKESAMQINEVIARSS